MKKQIKTRKLKKAGISLITLIITIIVLLILAGVTINLIIGEDGIIAKARQSKLAQEIAEIKERLGLDILDAQMEALARKENLEQSQLEDIISNYGQLQDDKNTIVLNDGKGSITLTDIYKETTSTTGSYTESQAKIELLESQIKILEEQLQDATQNETETQTELRELKDLLAQTTATADDIAEGKIAYSNNSLVTGTGANSKTIMGCEYVSITCKGLAQGTDYYTLTGSNTANSEIIITVNQSGATVENSGTYGSILYASDAARFYCKTTGINISDIECLSRLPSNEIFYFKRIELDCTLTATLTDTYTGTGSVSASSSGKIIINSDGTYETGDFLSGWSGTLYNSSLARYQCKTSLTVNNCVIE